MYGIIAEFFPLPKPTQSSDSPSVKCWEESVWRGPRYHYQQFDHSLSDSPVLQHAQDEGISLYVLQSCCRVGELIHQMVCWKDICRCSVLESCFQNSCDSGGRWT